jgi:hypothetical protein
MDYEELRMKNVLAQRDRTFYILPVQTTGLNIYWYDTAVVALLRFCQWHCISLSR